MITFVIAPNSQNSSKFKVQSCPQKAASRWFKVMSLQSMIFVTKGYG